MKARDHESAKPYRQYESSQLRPLTSLELPASVFSWSELRYAHKCRSQTLPRQEAIQPLSPQLAPISQSAAARPADNDPARRRSPRAQASQLPHHSESQAETTLTWAS